jgi:septal ring factor EnvC (AmiA/AmiB activator)
MSNDEMTTQPTIDALLARLDEWGARFTNEFSGIRTGQDELRTGQGELRQSVDELRKGQDELRKGQEELRADLNAGLRRVERKIEILNDNLLAINADIRDLEVRTEKLESASLVKG